MIKGFPQLAPAMHIISTSVVFIFFIFMFVLLFINNHKLNRYWDYVIAGFIFAAYAFVFLEVISNSNPKYHFFQTLLPWYNFSHLLVITGFIAIALPRKLKIRNYLLALTLLMSFGLIFGMVDTTLDYFKTFKSSFYEREFWIPFYQFMLIIYCVYSLNVGELKVTWKEILFTIGIMWVIYGVSFLINLKTDLSLFGVGKYFLNLIKYPDTSYALVDFGSILAFVLLACLFIVLPIRIKNRKK